LPAQLDQLCHSRVSCDALNDLLAYFSAVISHFCSFFSQLLCPEGQTSCHHVAGGGRIWARGVSQIFPQSSLRLASPPAGHHHARVKLAAAVLQVLLAGPSGTAELFPADATWVLSPSTLRRYDLTQAPSLWRLRLARDPPGPQQRESQIQLQLPPPRRPALCTLSSRPPLEYR